MKTKKSNQQSWFTGVALCCTLLTTMNTQAAPITWGPATTVSGDSDVNTDGTLVYAFDLSNTNLTINTVPFAAGNSGTSLGGGIITMTGVGTTYTGYSSASAPFSGLSPDYQNLLKGGAYGGTGVATNTLNGLIVGHTYKVQFWVNDARSYGIGRTETITSPGGNTITLDYNNTDAVGGFGQYTLGTFTANAASQTFSYKGSASSQMNAIQVRDVTDTIGRWTGNASSVWDGTSLNFCSNAWTAALSPCTFADIKTQGQTVYFTDSYYDSSSRTFITATNITVAAGGVSISNVCFLNTSRDYTLFSSDESGISGTSVLTIQGSRAVTLAGPNTYTGVTSINAGTLALSGGDNRITSGNTVNFGGGNYSVAALDMGATSQTLGSLKFYNTALTTSMTAIIAGDGGTLTINGNNDLQLGPYALAFTAINFSGLSNLVYNAPSKTFRVGFQSGFNPNTGASVSTVTLADSNTITAASLNLGDNVGSSGGGISRLHLGKANTLNVSAINIAASGRSHGYLDFATAGSTARIRNTDGTSAINGWSIGRVANFNTTQWNADVDFSLGTVDARVGTLVIATADTGAQSNRQGVANGSFKMGAGTVIATSVTLGKIANTGGGAVGGTYSAIGTLTLNQPSGTLTATTITLAENTITDVSNVTKSVKGTLNLTAGTVKATTVKMGVQTGTATATVAMNWSSGTIGNISGSDLLWTNVPITLLTTGSHVFDISDANVATLDVNSLISGDEAGITKSGTGTLFLSATNTYTGATIVNNGILNLSQLETLSTNTAVVINAPGKINLDFTGTRKIKSLTVNGELRLINKVFGAHNLSCLTGTGTLLTLDGSPHNETVIRFR